MFSKQKTYVKSLSDNTFVIDQCISIREVPIDPIFQNKGNDIVLLMQLYCDVYNKQLNSIDISIYIRKGLYLIITHFVHIYNKKDLRVHSTCGIYEAMLDGTMINLLPISEKSTILNDRYNSTMHSMTHDKTKQKAQSYFKV